MRLGEAALDQFIHSQNLLHYRRLLTALDQKDDVRRKTILKLLADEMAKDSPPQRA
jgi:hypothetical protein